MDDTDSDVAREASKQPARKRQWPVSALALGAASAIFTVAVLVGGYAIWRSMPGGPRLTEVSRENLEAARAQWKMNAPPSYDIEIAVEGPQRAVYRVEVRDGKVISATRNGSPLTDPRTMGTWSVPGMFDTIESDVDHSEQPIPITARESHYVTPMALFDPNYGYPSHYRRIEWGSDVEASWVVTEFSMIDE